MLNYVTIFPLSLEYGLDWNLIMKQISNKAIMDKKIMNYISEVCVEEAWTVVFIAQMEWKHTRWGNKSHSRKSEEEKQIIYVAHVERLKDSIKITSINQSCPKLSDILHHIKSI